MNDSKNNNGIIGWFANNHVAANILMLLFIIGGLISAATMRTETFPSIDPRIVQVTVVYPGATPFEVADSITSRVEEALIGIEGVKRITSSANEGSGSITVELKDFANADDVYNDVETEVNRLSDFPPEDAERPIVTKVRITPNVLSLALYGQASEETLRFWAETIEDEILQLPGVALTSVRGIRNYEISVEVSEHALREYNLSLEDIRNAVAQYSIDTPAGTIESRQGDILLRVQEKRFTAPEFESINIRTLDDGSTLTIGDIGQVNDGFQDVNLVSRFNGERAAFIDIKRSATDDTLDVANAVKGYLDQLKLPQNVNIAIQNDETVALRDRISLMVRNAVLGFMLVFLVLLLFLDLKLAFWVGAAIPISFLGGLMLVNMAGLSINMITLFALIVVLGIVVDDAVIVGESIFESQENAGEDPKSRRQAVIDGVKNVIAPVTIGVTTTMAAFAPLALSTGTLGQIIGIIPVVVIAILFVSLIEAYFILPAHLSSPKRWSKGSMAKIGNKFGDGLSYFVDHYIEPAARFCMTWRYGTLAAFLGIAIITHAMFTSGTIRFIFFPNVEADEVTISVTMPEGAPFLLTQNTINNIEREIETIRGEIGDTPENPIVKSISVSIGQTNGDAGPGGVTDGSSANNLGEIRLNLVPSDFRAYSASEIESLIRKRIENFPNIDELAFQSSLVGEDADIELEISHPEEKTLNLAAEELRSALESIPGSKEVSDSFETGKKEFVFSLTPEGFAVGLTPATLGQQLRSAFFGLEAQRLQRGKSEVIVYVRYPKEERESLSALSDTRIRLPNGNEVPLSAVAKITEQNGYSSIETVNGRRIVSITGDIDTAVSTPAEAIKQLEEQILPKLMERYAGLTYSFEGESREQSEDLASLVRNMGIALLIIFVLLGSILRSYIQPLIIMSAIPFGLIGATWGHVILGQDLTFISLFGMVALSGVVINDSVVLMDHLNRQHRSGKSIFDSAIIAIKRRFRPIMITTTTTALGLLPILLETSMQARFLIPMVTSLAMGIIFATVIILVLVPNLLLVIEDIKNLARNTMGKVMRLAGAKSASES